MTEFSDILDRQLDEIEEPKPTPQGIWRLRALAAKPKDGGEGDPYVMFTYAPIEPIDGVDEEALLAAGDVTTGRVFDRMYVREARDEWFIKKHLMKLGIDIQGKTTGEALKEVKGHEVVAELTHSWSDDGEMIYVNAGRFASVDEAA